MPSKYRVDDFMPVIILVVAEAQSRVCKGHCRLGLILEKGIGIGFKQRN